MPRKRGPIALPPAPLSQNGVTADADKQIAFETWGLSPAQLLVADQLALGATQSMAARTCNVNLRSVQRWCAEENFQAYVMNRVEEARAEWNIDLRNILVTAMKIELEVMFGKRRHDDGAAIRAADILARTVYRVAVLGALGRTVVSPGKGFY